MPSKAERKSVPAPEAPEAEANSAGVQTPEADNVQADNVQAPEIETPEAPTAVQRAAADVAEIEVALNTAKAPALVAVLEAQLAEALGALALATAEAGVQAERHAAEAEAHSAVVGITDPARRQRLLDSMLAAIELEYAPAALPEAPDATPDVTAPARQVSARTAERNASVAAQYGADSALRQRAIDTLAAWDSADVATCLAQRQAGTRYASLVALAPHSAGVANAADYRILATAVRLYLLEIGLPANGSSTAEAVWLARRGKSFAPNAPKGASAVQACFSTLAELALYADGKFRLAPRGTAGVQFASASDAAWNLFIGAADSMQMPLSAAPEQTGQLALPEARTAPTAPNVQADATSGKLTPLLACQHCGTRNVATFTECRSCQADDWNASA